MMSPFPVRGAPCVRSAVSLAGVSLCLVLSSLSHAAEPSGELQPVLVTATRSPQVLQTAPIGASIITAEQIERSGVVDANEAIRKLGGVVGRGDLSNGREYTLDLRGFGATADQNIVVLVDGIRLSENELVSARLSAIPLSQIERIEITRGGASVSWGEGASAGVINVILKDGQVDQASARLSTSVESFGGRDTNASALLPLGQFTTLESSLRYLTSDGYRDNAEYRQSTGSVGLRWAYQGWRAKFRVQREDQDARLPGWLTFDQFKDDPRQTFSPDDFSGVRETLYVANVAYQSGPWTASLDLGHKDRSSTYSDASPFASDTERSKRQISPRLTYATRDQDVAFSATLGLDWERWDFDNVNTYGQETGKQSNRARYVRADLTLPSRTRLSAGLRSEKVRKQADSTSASYDRRDSLRASELAISQTVWPGWDVYGRLASSYRLPNIDENRYTFLSQALKPQKNRDKELGVKWSYASTSGTARWFRQTTVNEIFFDSNLFSNVNIDPTLRRGYELELRWQPIDRLDLSATWQQLRARYRQGPNAGLTQVLVSPRTATLRAAYQLDDRQTVDVGLQYTAAMRLGDDADNQCARRIPAATWLDARYAWSNRVWTVAVSGTNLTDRISYNYAFSCVIGGIYPEPGRALKFTVSRQF